MIEFSKEETAALTQKIQVYFSEELDQELGQFPAEFLLDFFTQQIGPYYYNRALLDAQTVLTKHIESIGDVFYEMEKALPR